MSRLRASASRSRFKAAAQRSDILCVDLGGAPAKGGLTGERCGHFDLAEGGDRALVLLRCLWQERLFVLIVGARVEQRGVLRAKRQVQSRFDGMQVDEVAQDVPLHRLDEGWPAALQAFEQVGATEAHQAFASVREILQLLCFRGGWPLFGRFRDVVGQAVARQVQPVDDLHHIVSIEQRVGIACSFVLDEELDGARDTRGEIGTEAWSAWA